MRRKLLAFVTLILTSIFAFTLCLGCGKEEKKVLQKIDFSQTSIELYENETKNTTVVTTPKDFEGTITYSSDNTSIATVDKNGVISGVKKGTTTITATLDGKTATLSVTVKVIPPESVTFEKAARVMYIGEPATYPVIITPSDYVGEAVFTSNDESIATVTTEGLITPVAVGTTTITADVNGKTATLYITVNPKKPDSLAFSSETAELRIGETQTFIATYLPVDYEGEVVYISDMPNIATIDQNGLVTCIAKGTVTLYAQLGGLKATLELTVVQPNKESEFLYKGVKYTLNTSTGNYAAGIDTTADIEENIVIKSNIFGYKTTTISNRGFYGTNGIKSVVIEAGITIIDASAFSGCANLESVTLPNTTFQIGASAFSGCSKLKAVSIPSSVERLGESAFEDCTNLESVELSTEISAIMERTFASCSSLKSIVMSDKIIRIKARAFEYCTALEDVRLSLGLDAIEDNAFAFCKSLKSILFPSSKPLTLGSQTFEEAGLVNVYIPKNVTLGNYTFKKLAWDETIANPNEPTNPGASMCQGIYYESEMGSRGTNTFGYTWNRPDLGFRIYVPSGSMPYYESTTGVDESWGRCVVNSVNASDGERVLQEYDIATTFPDGFPCLK